MDGSAPPPGLRVGVRLPQYGGSWPALRDAALHAERLGFAHLWVNDHLWTPGRLHATPAFDALSTLAALAPLTRTVGLGTAVLSAAFRPPALAAKQAAVLDVISGGRLILGVGTGSDRAEHEAYGIPYGTAGERTAGVERLVDAVRAMGERPEGAEVPGLLHEAPFVPPPVQRPHPPLWLAAHGPRLLRLAGRRADGIVAAFLDPPALAARLATAGEARAAAGRPPLSCALYTYVMPAGSSAEAEAWLRPEAEALGTTPARLRRWLEGTGIAGADGLRDALAAFARAGATDAILVLPNRVPPEALEALAGAALPRGTAPAAARAATGARPEANLAHLLVQRHRDAGRGAGRAVVDEHGAWTFDELAGAASRAAGALAAAGARRGDRVAVALRDGRPWAAAVLGAAWLGAVAVPLDPGAPPERMAMLLDDCEPVVVVAAGPPPPGPWTPLGPGDLDGPAWPMAAVHPEDRAYLVYSSGSTGPPKGALHAHRDMAVSVDGYFGEVLGVGPGDACHSIAKGFTSLGFGNGFFRPLGRGATAVLAGVRPTPRSVLDAVARHRVTVLTAVPTAWAQLDEFLRRHPDRAPALHGLRLGVSSGDALPPAVADRLRGRGLDVLEGLGCSECSHVVLSTRPGVPQPGTVGAPVPGAQVSLRDGEGLPVPSGAPGRLWIRCLSNTSGYWRRAAETREVVFGEWVRMGDVLVERDGVYRHVGRSDDLFKVDARWVSPVEVEGVITGRPDVREAAVVGLPDGRGLMRVAAFVVMADGEPDPGFADALRRDVARRLGTHAAPTRVEVVPELPRLPSGKLDRRALRGG